MNLKKIKEHCLAHSKISTRVIDELAVPYAIEPKHLGKEMDRRFARYRHITRMLPPSFLPLLQSQYLAHAVFKQDGAIRKYMNHAEFRILSESKRSFLEDQAASPWRFSFAHIEETLGDDFYEMSDVFAQEKYLLYSPGIKDTLKNYSYHLWFNLIAFNGECYQSFGPIIGYQAFTADDIFFFGTELDEDTGSDEDLIRLVEHNPVPFMMLVSGSTLPAIVTRGEHEMKYAFSDIHVPELPESFPADVFDVQENSRLVKLRLAGEEDAPHFAAAYYDKEEEMLQLTSLTLHGYKLLVRAFKKLSFEFDEWPDQTISFPIKSVTEKILQREIELFPYESFFAEMADPDPDTADTIARINQVMQEILPAINNNEEPDIQVLAVKYDLDEESLKNIVEHTLERMNNLK